MMMYDLCRIRERKFGFALLMRRKTMDNKPHFLMLSTFRQQWAFSFHVEHPFFMCL